MIELQPLGTGLSPGRDGPRGHWITNGEVNGLLPPDDSRGFVEVVCLRPDYEGNGIVTCYEANVYWAPVSVLQGTPHVRSFLALEPFPEVAGPEDAPLVHGWERSVIAVAALSLDMDPLEEDEPIRLSDAIKHLFARPAEYDAQTPQDEIYRSLDSSLQGWAQREWSVLHKDLEDRYWKFLGIP